MAKFHKEGPHWWHPEQKRYITNEPTEMPEDAWLELQVLSGYIIKTDAEPVKKTRQTKQAEE